MSRRREFALDRRSQRAVPHLLGVAAICAALTGFSASRGNASASNAWVAASSNLHRLRGSKSVRFGSVMLMATMDDLEGGGGFSTDYVEAEDKPIEAKSSYPDLLAMAAEVGAPGSFEALLERVEEDMPRISPEDLNNLQAELAKGDDAPAGAADLARAIQMNIEKKMEGAKKQIEDLINVKDGDVTQRIKKILKEAESPLPYFMVLQMNLAEAQEAGDEAKTRAMLHITTVMNEELEKKVSRVSAMLNRLMRMDDAGVRANILRHHLEPMDVGGAAMPDDFNDVEDFTAAPKIMAALVPPERLGVGIADLCKQVGRQFQVGGEAGQEVRFDTLDKIRAIAKDARIVIGELYGEAAMNDFGADLTPAFHELMLRKQQVEQEENDKRLAELEESGNSATAP